MLSRVKDRTNSIWRELHPLIIERTSTILIVNQVMTGENFSNKFEAYLCFPPWMFMRVLCLNTHLVYMYILRFNAYTDGRTCYYLGTYSLGISCQCFRSIKVLTSLMIAFLKSLFSGAFMDWWQLRLSVLLLAASTMVFIMSSYILRLSSFVAS